VEILNLFESLGVVLPRKASGETAEYVRGFRAGVCRTDLNPAARASLPNHLAAFYNMAGYSTDEPADSILTMTAFAARLAIDTSQHTSKTMEAQKGWSASSTDSSTHTSYPL
jgi:hypothetical protein